MRCRQPLSSHICFACVETMIIRRRRLPSPFTKDKAPTLRSEQIIKKKFNYIKLSILPSIRSAVSSKIILEK